MQADCIIVGQGIAGTVLAHTLRQHGQSCVVIDQPRLSSSSAVAAGIWNPVVFKRLAKSWMADEVLPVMAGFYRDCGTQLQQAFITERRIIKPLVEAHDMDFWKQKALSGNAYLDEDIHRDYALSPADTAAHYSFVKGAGNLDVPAFLQAGRELFAAEGKYLEEEFDFEALQIHAAGVSYKHITAQRIVFCEGHLVHRNPFFSYIPMKPAKGEVLTIRCDSLLTGTDIFNRNFFILPLGSHLYKVGATYEWAALNDLPTEKAKEELLARLRSLLNVPFEVIQHQAGVRPSVIDRRPVLGRHPNHPHVYVFNGFGTKAVMLAPYFAIALCRHMLEGQNLINEVDIRRFHKNE